MPQFRLQQQRSLSHLGTQNMKTNIYFTGVWDACPQTRDMQTKDSISCPCKIMWRCHGEEGMRHNSAIVFQERCGPITEREGGLFSDCGTARASTNCHPYQRKRHTHTSRHDGAPPPMVPESWGVCQQGAFSMQTHFPHSGKEVF